MITSRASPSLFRSIYLWVITTTEQQKQNAETMHPRKCGKKVEREKERAKLLSLSHLKQRQKKRLRRKGWPWTEKGGNI